MSTRPTPRLPVGGVQRPESTSPESSTLPQETVQAVLLEKPVSQDATRPAEHLQEEATVTSSSESEDSSNPSSADTQPPTRLYIQPPHKPRSPKPTRPPRQSRSSKPARSTRASTKKYGLPGAAAVLAIVGILSLLSGILGFYTGIVPALLNLALLVAGIVFVFWSKLPSKLLPPRHNVPALSPTLGFPGIFWKYLGGKWLYQRTGWSHLTAVALREREERVDNELWEMRETPKTVAFSNTSGKGAKSTGATWFAGTDALNLKRHVLAWDVNESPGSTAWRFGMEREDTLQNREFLRLCAQIEAPDCNIEELYALIESQLAWHRVTGTSVIASESEALSTGDITLKSVLTGIRVATYMAHRRYIDLGNVIKAPGNLGAVHMADNLVITANSNSPDSMRTIGDTKKSYHNLGYVQKAQDSFLVIFGVKERERATYAKKYGFDLDHTFVVQPDAHMKLQKEVDPSKIKRRTRIQIKEAKLAVIKAPAADQAQNPPLPTDYPTDHRTRGSLPNEETNN